MASAEQVRQLRDRIRRELPADTFKEEPWRLVWFLPLVAVVILCDVVIAQGEPGWLACLLLSLVIGHCYGALGFLAHEVSHGALGVQGRWKSFFAGLGFAPFLVTPAFWHRWHNVVHHGNTNRGDLDPDSFGTMKRYERHPSQKKLLKLAPGSGTWYSYFFLFYSFLLHSQVVLWLQTKHRKEFAGFDRVGAIRNMLLMLLFWVGLGVWMGPKAAFFALVLPLLWGNSIVQGYILTNHFMRPQTEVNDPVENSMSLRTLKVLDALHFHFSHHVEHHLFPKMSSRQAPKVRAWFLQNMPERYVWPTHLQALRYMYSTPKVYLDANTLVDVNNPSYTVEIHALTEKLQAV